MNAEALIGTVLGTCTLQKLVGQGGMGAVYLAQQSRPKRQVAVKVLLPMTPLNPNQLAAFLERFRRETDAAASLEHPNIMPVHEYGEQDGIAYLVMPYISGGTLRDELEREGQLSLPSATNYLEQMAAALDFAHEHGVIHRDIKPANIMMTPEGRLLLSDFGLVKIISEGQTPQVRLTGAGAPVGTPDYMAPEQVIGEEIDTRADLYSLGVILYQMITGTTPFQGETPMQIAAQHLQVQPLAPKMLRPDLPTAAEQVILRALAKRPADRYMLAQEMAFAFRSALISSGIRLDAIQTWAGLLSGSTSARMPVPQAQFEPTKQAAATLRVATEDVAQQRTGSINRGLLTGTGAVPVATDDQWQKPSANDNPRPTGGLLSRTGMMSSIPQSSLQETGPNKNQAGGGLLSRTGQFPMVGTGTIPSIKQGGGLLSKTGQFPMVGTGGIAPVKQEEATLAPETGGSVFSPTWTKEPLAPTPAFKSPTGFNNTGTLIGPEQGSSTVRLNDPVKVVKVPVTGQPGQFVTGLLPFTKQAEEEQARKELPAPNKRSGKAFVKIGLIAALIIIVLGSVGAFLFTRSHPGQQATAQQGRAQQSAVQQTATPTDPRTLAQIQATATAQANIILSDPLDKNIHNWLTNPPDVYAFKNGAYHITDHGDTGAAVALPARTFDDPLAYQLTLQEINGDDTSGKNTFGMIFRFNQDTRNGKKVTTFYSFEVVNVKGGEYEFWRYDDSNKDNAWTMINDGHLPLGNEYHQGKGQQATNTIKIAMKGNKFTVIVNGKTLAKTFQDDALKTGTVGMIVNNDGTEVAFSNLLLTRS
jgi:serine/threonine protein kinase